MPARVSAQIDGDFVVFLIGMRINKPWKLQKWWPVFTAMPQMLKELQAAGPAIGFLGHNGLSMRCMVQYWRSFDHLEAYARSKDHKHWPAWVNFNTKVKNSRGDVGIWHETYLIKAGQYEAIYSGMPIFGLRKAGRAAEITADTDGARLRLTP